MTPTFNLVDESWIPVVDAGDTVEVSIRDALVRAHELAGLGVGDPLETVAVFRQVLLPVYLAATGVPASEAEWGERWAARRLDPGPIESYLDEHFDRFDLFSPELPFAQVAGLRTAKDETKPVSLMIAAVATGNNVPLFSARTEARPPALRPAEAARVLLATHCWDTAAIKSGAVGDPQAKAGKTTGNPTGPLGALGVVMPLGATLFETLLLNTPVRRATRSGDDSPQWARDQGPTWETRPVRGILDLLTWMSRRIRLFPDTDSDGGVVVRRVIVAAGDRMDRISGDEPHTAWRKVEKPKAGQPSNRPVRHVPGRAAWRGLEALLMVDKLADAKFSPPLLLTQLSSLADRRFVPPDLRLQLLTVGVQYGNQSAVVEDVMADLIPLPVLALDAASDVRMLLIDVVTQVDELRRAADRLEADLRRATGGEQVPWDKGQHLGELLVHRIAPGVRRLLGGLQRDPDRVDDAEVAWKTTARRLALEIAAPVLAAVPPGAFLGRQDGKHVYRVTDADRWYRHAVNKTLGVPPADLSQSRGDNDAA
jgi:CRISPR system Cascade subunit CasA